MAGPGTIVKIAHTVIQKLRNEDGRRQILLLIMLPIMLLILIIASPLAIFFAVTGDYGESIAGTMHSLESELLTKVESEKTGADEYVVSFEGSEDDTAIINVQDVIAVFAVRENMAGITDLPDAVAHLTSQQLQKLKHVFWDMNIITTSIEEKVIPYEGVQGYDHDGNPIPTPAPTIWRIKHINVNSLNYSEVIDDYHLNDDQVEVLEELMDAKYASLFIGMMGTGAGAIGNNGMGGLTQQEIDEIRAELPPGLSESRQAVVARRFRLWTVCAIFGEGNQRPSDGTADGDR